MSSASSDDSLQRNSAEQNASIQAAVARTLSRSLALYFSRPVRLFRPSKISGWQSLRSLAEHQGSAFDHRFLFSVVKLQGFSAIQKHFLPPMIVNAILGTVLWTTYSEAYSRLESSVISNPIMAAAVSGGIAGGVQAVIAAPVENVRIAIEGGSTAQSWAQAWKDVARSPSSKVLEDHHTKLHEIRELRNWMKEVGGMAGRGWSGWGWGCAKDMCAFPAFFAIFEVTRRVAQTTKSHSQDIISYMNRREGRAETVKNNIPRTVHGIILVSGGVLAGLAYEVICRPFDRARRLIYLSNLESNHAHTLKPLVKAIRTEGLETLFYDPDYKETKAVGYRQRMYSLLRTLGRVGPWGVGFLVWEAYGVGLS